MRYLFVFVYCLFLFSCKPRTGYHSSTSLFNSDKDTVTRNLIKLPDSLITKIDAEPCTLIFDSVQRGNTLLAKFKIRNIGHTPLKIEQIIFSCDCVSPLYQYSAIPPGEVKSVDFAINTESFNKGYNERVITLLGNFRPFFKFLRIEIYIQ